jgi:hypothetical protein
VHEVRYTLSGNHGTTLTFLRTNVNTDPAMSKLLTQRLTAGRLDVLEIGPAATAVPSTLFAQQPTLPRGSIIRTVRGDDVPEELPGSATLPGQRRPT